MIVHIDFTPPELASILRDTLQGFVSEAIRSYRLGYHLLVIERDAADYLIAELQLNEIERNTIKQLKADFTQTRDLVRRASVYLRVAALPVGTIRLRGNAVEASIDQAVLSIFGPTLLVVEDEITDGGLLRLIIHALGKLLRMPQLHWEFVHGGGSRLYEITESRSKARRIVCAITDTDRHSPASLAPKKVSDLQKLPASLNWPLSFIFLVPGHEIENVIPVSVLELLPCAQARGAEISLHKLIANREQNNREAIDNSLWLYSDLKIGYSLDRLPANFSDADKAWYSSKAELAGRDCLELAGFGNNIVSQILDDNAAISRLLQDVRTRSWREVFEEFFSGIIWLCIGGQRQFV